jgi:hypothetical protein
MAARSPNDFALWRRARALRKHSSASDWRLEISGCRSSLPFHVAQGHCLRVSVSCANFPQLWPTRTNPQIRVFCGGSSRASAIRLPIVPPAMIAGPALQPPDPTVNRVPLTLDFTPRWQLEHDLAAGTVAVTTGERPILLTPSGDGRVELNHTAKASVTAARPDAARVEGDNDHSTAGASDLPTELRQRETNRPLRVRLQALTASTQKAASFRGGLPASLPSRGRNPLVHASMPSPYESIRGNPHYPHIESRPRSHRDRQCTRAGTLPRVHTDSPATPQIPVRW